jgi:hypothetical protein
VKGRDDRCTLAAAGHVQAPQIRNRVDTGNRRNAVRIAQLPRKGFRRIGLMPDRLAVMADRGDIGRVDSGRANDRNGAVGKEAPDGDIIGFAPPLCLTRDEADIAATALARAVESVL